jgi:transketolase
MRKAFINKLISQAEKDERIFLICGDLGYSVLENFKIKFPKRFLNIGIAEQNMAGVAAGLALEGFKVFIYSIGNFPSLRALEQIRYDICYHNLDVTVVSVGAGLSYGALGSSHHATEDISIMRALPNLTIYNPGDPNEVEYCLMDLLNQNSPCYLRLGKSGEPSFYKKEYRISGFLNPIVLGNDSLVLATGSICFDLKNKLASLNSKNSLYSLSKFGKTQGREILELCSKYKKIYTIEEHQLNGGFGSFVFEIIMDGFEEGFLKTPPIIKRFGLNNFFISEAGTQEYLREKYIIKDFMEHLAKNSSNDTTNFENKKFN